MKTNLKNEKFKKIIYFNMFDNFEKIENADLKQYSTMRTGGCAKVIVFPKNIGEIVKILKICQKNREKTLILGNGSNILFDDNGFDGVIISLKHFNKIKICKGLEPNVREIEVGAGINLFQLNQKLAKRGLSGLEWSYGIPATLGGLLVMNGGAFGHEICEFVKEVKVLDGGKIREINAEQAEFSYRHSNLQKYIVLGANLQLSCEKTENILEKMNFFLAKRKESQPYEFPSLGSVFKQIRGEEIVYPAKLLDKMGLKGVRIGKAEISKKHAGFIINTGGATSADVLALIEFMECQVSKVGVTLEREIVVLKK